MKITDIKKDDVLVNVDRRGAGFYRVLKVNRVTIDVRGENGNKVRAYPAIFDRCISIERIDAKIYAKLFGGVAINRNDLIGLAYPGSNA